MIGLENDRERMSWSRPMQLEDGAHHHDGELVPDSDRIGAGQIEDRMNPHRVRTLGQPRGDTPDLDHGQPAPLVGQPRTLIPFKATGSRRGAHAGPYTSMDIRRRRLLVRKRSRYCANNARLGVAGRLWSTLIFHQDCSSTLPALLSACQALNCVVRWGPRRSWGQYVY